MGRENRRTADTGTYSVERISITSCAGRVRLISIWRRDRRRSRTTADRATRTISNDNNNNSRSSPETELVHTAPARPGRLAKRVKLTRLKLTKSKRIWLISFDTFLTRNEHSPTSFNNPGKFGLTKYVTLLATSALHDDVTAKQIARARLTVRWVYTFVINDRRTSDTATNLTNTEKARSPWSSLTKTRWT